MDRVSGLDADAPVARALWRDADAIAVELGTDGVVQAANPGAQRFFGAEQPALFDLVNPQDAPRLMKLLARELAAPAELRITETTPGTGSRTIEVVSVSGPWDDAGTLTLIAHDVTSERRTAGALDALRQVLELLANGEPLPAVLDGLARAVAQAAGGAAVAVLLARGNDLELVAAPNLRADAAAAFSRVPGGASPEAFPGPGGLTGALAEAALAHGLGFGWAAPVIEGDAPRALLLLFPGAKRFPTAEEQAAIESAVPLARIALTTDASRAAVDRADRLDPLTGVLVRRAFLAELESVGRRARDTIGLLLVAIDDLGAVNEHFGRDTGDDLLHTVGRRLAGIVRGRDLVGRASANRFAIACITAADNEPLERFAARVREVMAQPYQHDGRPVPIVVRVAVASHRGRLGEPIALLADAERALRALRAGASGRPGPDGRPSVFDSGRPDRTERRQRHSGSAASDR